MATYIVRIARYHISCILYYVLFSKVERELSMLSAPRFITVTRCSEMMVRTQSNHRSNQRVILQGWDVFVSVPTVVQLLSMHTMSLSSLLALGSDNGSLAFCAHRSTSYWNVQLRTVVNPQLYVKNGCTWCLHASLNM